MASAELRRLDALADAALRLARSAPSGRVALARLAAVVDPAWFRTPRGTAFAAELEAARAEASTPVPFRDVERTLRDAWGAKPSAELDDLEAEPVASTPVAQVHRGVLDGEAVSVKVRRPRLESVVRQDLALLEPLAVPLAAAFPALDVGGLLREVRERVLEELDLEHEAQTQRRLHRALRSHPAFGVPAPVTRLCHDAVLVSAWVDGVPLTEAPDRDAAAAALVTFAIGVARFGVAHAGLTAEDVLVEPDGRLAVLDLGAARAVEPGRLQHAAAAADALAAGDGAALGAAAEALGWLPAGDGPAALRLLRDVLGELAAGESRLDAAALRAAGLRLAARAEDAAALLGRAALPAPDLWPGRGLAQLFATIARAGATADWLGLVRGALRDGWNQAL